MYEYVEWKQYHTRYKIKNINNRRRKEAHVCYINDFPEVLLH